MVMKFNNYSRPDEIKLELSSRFKALRLSFDYSQAYISAKSGVSLRTIKSFEKNGTISLDNLIKVLKVLGVADNLNYLIPELGLNVVDLHHLGHQKKRVSKKKKKVNLKWGDED